MHTSYAYPSHLVILLDLALVILAGLLVLARPGASWPLAARGERWLRRLARRPGRAVLAIGTAGALGTALTFVVFGPPQPRIVDELSYLLAADTFASGRVANPSHPMWRHFETPHVLQWPSYASKYPPAQGLVLALGQVLGSPAVALCLSAGLLAAAMSWMFLAWLPPPWAVLGGVLVLLRLGVGSYWNQSYWGGSVAAIGGALLYGALPRLAARPRVGLALALAAGLVILANSRPYEGLLASLPAAAVTGRWMLARERRRVLWGRVGLPVLAVLLLAAGGMAHYNRRVTGDPWLLPHVGHNAAYNLTPEFVFQPRRGPALESQARAPGWPAAAPDGPRRPWLGRALGQGLRRAGRTLYFFLGLAMILPLLVAALRRLGGPRTGEPRTGGPSYGVLLAACALVFAGEGLSTFWWPHYAAPIAGPLSVLALAALRSLRDLRWRGRAVGRPAAAAVLGIHAVLFLVQLPAYRADEGDWSLRRAEIQARLDAGPDRHLVVVRGSAGISRPARGGDWIRNAADIDGSAVVWARDLGPEANRALLDHFAGRRVWWLDLERRGEPEPVPFPENRASPAAGSGTTR